MCPRVLLCVLAITACAGRQSYNLPKADGYDRAYLAMRAAEQGCAPDAAVACCTDLEARLRTALDQDDMAAAATTADALAIYCPSKRRTAIAALDHKPKPVTPEGQGAIVAVTYVLDLGPGDRVYWLGDFVDGKHPSRAQVAPGPHTLDVEAHVMTVGDGGRDRLLTLRASQSVDVVAKEGANVTVIIKRVPGKGGDNPFVVLFPDKWQSKSALAQQAKPRPAMPDPKKAVVAGGQLREMGDARYPSELKDPGRTALGRVCIGVDGQVESVSPLASPHPRYTAALVFGLFQARYAPATIDGQPVPMCKPVKLNFM